MFPSSDVLVVTLLGPWVLGCMSKCTKGPLKYKLHTMSCTVVNVLSELFLYWCTVEGWGWL